MTSIFQTRGVEVMSTTLYNLLSPPPPPEKNPVIKSKDSFRNGRVKRNLKATSSLLDFNYCLLKRNSLVWIIYFGIKDSCIDIDYPLEIGSPFEIKFLRLFLNHCASHIDSYPILPSSFISSSHCSD